MIANPKIDVASIDCLKSSAIAKNLNPFFFVKMVSLVKKGAFAALNMRDTN